MKLLIQILLIILVISTVFICAVKPDMHKTVIVYNSDYAIVPEQVTKIESETIPIMEAPVKPKETVIKVEKTVQTPQKQVKAQTVKTTEKKTPVKKTEVKTEKTEKTYNTPTPKTVEAEKPAPVKKVETVKKAEATKVLTQQQEEIAWNIWRSNLQNKIMRDVFLPSIPEGTIFQFSFTVDKYGRVSNVQTFAKPSSYTPYAIQYIAPVIRSYQGKDILNFPAGSTRISTEVKGGWKISFNEKYSTPQDYNDVEKVVRY